MEMDHKNQIAGFAELGLSHPSRPKRSMKKSLEIVNTYDFYTEVYDQGIMKEIMDGVAQRKNIKPPKCIFVPGRRLMRIMMNGVCRYGHEPEYKFFLRFGMVLSKSENS